jgi:hypothetical protein
MSNRHYRPQSRESMLDFLNQRPAPDNFHWTSDEEKVPTEFQRTMAMERIHRHTTHRQLQKITASQAPLRSGPSSREQCTETAPSLAENSKRVITVLQGQNDEAAARCRLVSAIVDAWGRMATISNCEQAFKATGICPFSPDTMMASEHVQPAGPVMSYLRPAEIASKFPRKS